jgi:hypothetical protein
MADEQLLSRGPLPKPSSHDLEEPIMQAITTIGLDIAKSVFQVHAIDAEGKVIIRRKLKCRYVLAFFQSCRPAWLDPGLRHRASLSSWRWAPLSLDARPGALPSMRPSGPLALNRSTQSRIVCSPTPPIRAAP